MIASQLRLQLAVEALLLLFLARFVADGGAGWFAAFLLLWLAVRALAVGFTFFLAWMYRAPDWVRHRLDAGRWLRLLVGEWAAFVALFSVLQPFERWLMAPDRLHAPAAGEAPLLLVHGYQCNRGAWWWWRRWLEARGYCVATVSLEPPLADIDVQAAVLGRRIEEVCAITGSAQLCIVAHSMGGLVARAYLRLHGGARVRALVTLGSPHRGAVIARLGWGRCARQMEPGNAWLAELDQAPLPAALPVVAFASAHDNFVMPQDSAALPGKSIVLAGLGHLQMGFSRALATRVLEVLQDARARTTTA